jgi:hypothetical protein
MGRIRTLVGDVAYDLYGHRLTSSLPHDQLPAHVGVILDGNRRWVLRFAPGQLPPVTEFWSITMYNLPQRFLVDNPLNRYSIGDRTTGLAKGADGSLEIYMQAESPGPGKESNWVPTDPKRQFELMVRLYGPKKELLEKTWALPDPQQMQ